MMEQMTLDQYRGRNKLRQNPHKEVSMKSKKSKSEMANVIEHLKAMAYYFELDEKKANFYIAQIKATGKT